MKLLTALLACTLFVATVDGHAARRLGGGSSMGKQSSNVTQREAGAAPAAAPGAGAQGAAAQPAQSAAAAQRPAAASAAAPAAPRRPWGAMLGGLAAGLGLAWLAHSLGFGEGLAQFMLFGLLALAIMLAVGVFLRARKGAGAARDGLALQGAGAPADLARAPRQYSPDKVGNDASARPFERAVVAMDAARGLQLGSAPQGSQNWGIPAGFDVAGFLDAAKRNFISLQDAWDRSDIQTLRAMMTDGMTGEIRSQLAEREALRGAGQPNKTDVVMLDAQLLGIEDLGADYMASVEYSGMIREEPSAGPSPFREVWNMTKPKSGSSGWLVAGVQALQ